MLRGFYTLIIGSYRGVGFRLLTSSKWSNNQINCKIVNCQIVNAFGVLQDATVSSEGKQRKIASFSIFLAYIKKKHYLCSRIERYSAGTGSIKKR